MRRVVITGMGMVTPLGVTTEGSWQAMLEGKSGIGPVRRFDAAGLPVRIAGEVPGTLLNETGPELERHSLYGIEAARQAVRMSGLDSSSIDASRFGVVVGSGDSRVAHGPAELGPLFAACRAGDKVDLSRLDRASEDVMSPALYSEGDTLMPAVHIARNFGAYGVNRTCLTACAASSQALGEAFKAIQYGDADIILAGGCQALVTLEGLVGFTLLNALSKRNDQPEQASRPFDAERDGFILSEGGGVLVLEELGHAQARSAGIYAEMKGYGASADAFRVTDPHPEGIGAVLCMKRALQDAGLAPEDISYVNAHGTSTKANDAVESKAISAIFGDYRVPVTSCKSCVGHLIAATGAVELITAVLSIRDKVIPPTINYNEPDPACDVEVVANNAREARPAHILSNSFGFGGQNVSLVVSEYV